MYKDWKKSKQLLEEVHLIEYPKDDKSMDKKHEFKSICSYCNEPFISNELHCNLCGKKRKFKYLL